MSTQQRGRPGVRDDFGMSLVEVVVYAMLSALMLMVVGSVFGAGWASAQLTTRRDTATGTALAITNSVHGSIRNATDDFTVGDNYLVAKVATGKCGWEYHAWWLDGTDLLYRSGSTAPAIPAAGSRSGWVTIASGVSIRPGATSGFVKNGARLDLNLRARSGQEAVLITSGVVAQAKGTPPC